MSTEQLVARQYLRVSKDTSGTGRSPDQQQEENARSILANGWVLHSAPAYRDTDRSASRYAKTTREDFRRLIDDLEKGTFDADVLAIWESSRGSRRVGEWVDLVDLCKARGIRIWVTTHGRLYDPANARDRRSLLEDAVDAEYESDKTSERLRRSARAAAEQGRPHGRNIYGYRRIYDERTRALLHVEPHPVQAPIVQEAARRVLQGDTFYKVARDFNARGVPPRGPRARETQEPVGWHPSSIKQMLRIASYTGMRDYRGEIVSDGMWPALIDVDDWRHLQHLMSDSHRRGPRDHTARHLLSNIARCGVCGGPLKSRKQNYTPRTRSDDGTPLPRRTYRHYVCAGLPGHRGPDGLGWHVGIKANFLEEIVLSAFLARLTNPGRTSPVEEPENVRKERAALVAEITALEAYLDDVRQQAAEQRRLDLLIDQERRVQPLLDIVRDKLQRLSSVDPFIRELLDDRDIATRWETLTLDEQRRALRAIVQPVVHRVERSERGRRGLNHDRVELRWQ